MFLFFVCFCLISPHLTLSQFASLYLTKVFLISPDFTSSHLTSLHLILPPHLTSPLTIPHLSPHLILTSLHLTSPHLTSLHLTSFSLHFTSPHFNPTFSPVQAITASPGAVVTMSCLGLEWLTMSWTPSIRLLTDASLSCIYFLHLFFVIIFCIYFLNLSFAIIFCIYFLNLFFEFFCRTMFHQLIYFSFFLTKI